MSMHAIIAAEARLIVLRELASQPDGRLNSELLRVALESYGITRSRDYVHEELRWLADIGAATTTAIGSVVIAAITAKGIDHVERRVAIEGIKRPSPKE